MNANPKRGSYITPKEFVTARVLFSANDLKLEKVHGRVISILLKFLWLANAYLTLIVLTAKSTAVCPSSFLAASGVSIFI